MAKNKINDLRDHLFETLEALKDPDKPMDLERAKAVSDIAQTIINTAKVEVEMARALDFRLPQGTSFFNFPEEGRELPKIAEGANRRDIPIARAAKA